MDNLLVNYTLIDNHEKAIYIYFKIASSGVTNPLSIL